MPSIKLAVGALLVALTGVACGGNGDAPHDHAVNVHPSVQPREALDGATRRVREAKTYRFRVAIDGTETLRFEGTADLENRLVQYLYDLGEHATEDTGSRMEARTDGTTVWYTYPDSNGSWGGSGKRWLEVTAEELAEQTGIDIRLFDLKGAIEEIDSLSVKPSSKMREAGSEDIDGSPTTHYVITAAVPGTDAAAEVHTWVDGEGYLRQVKTSLPGAGTATIQIFAYGDEAEIDRPSPEETIKAEEVEEISA